MLDTQHGSHYKWVDATNKVNNISLKTLRWLGCLWWTMMSIQTIKCSYFIYFFYSNCHMTPNSKFTKMGEDDPWKREKGVWMLGRKKKMWERKNNMKLKGTQEGFNLPTYWIYHSECTLWTVFWCTWLKVNHADDIRSRRMVKLWYICWTLALA